MKCNENAREIRLFDSQWVNIVNHDGCYADYSKDDAVAAAVKMTETQMAKNFEENNWPVRSSKEEMK